MARGYLTTKEDRLQDYIHNSMRRKKVTLDDLAKKLNVGSKQAMKYRIDHNLLTFIEVSEIFELLGTTDETKLGLMK